MDFSFTEEQTLLRNSVQRYLADTYKYEDWRKFTRSEAGRDPKHWAQFAELGLLAAPLPEAHGGLGGDAVSTMVEMEEFGRALVIEPYVPTVVIGGGLIERAGSEAMKEEWLPKIAGGETLMAFAFAEPQGRFNLADIGTSAKKSGAGYVLNGQKSVVVGAPFADTLIVTARSAGGRRDASGVSVFLVDKTSKGIATRDYPTVDGNRASEITFENVEVPGVAAGRRGRWRPAACRARGRRGHRGGLLRCGGRDARAARRDRRILQDAQAVRRSDRQVPGAAAPHGRHVRQSRAVGVDHADGDAEARERCRAGEGGLGGQGPARPVGTLRRPGRGADPWRQWA